MFKFTGTSTKKCNPSIHDESLWVTQAPRRVLSKESTGLGFRADCSGAHGGATRY